MLIPGGGKCDWTTKSPLTGGYASASMGGLFTAEMKYAGLDSIILEGISPKPVYLFIDDHKIELRDAAEYWGKGTFAVEKAFKDKFGEEFQVAVIGPGGENGVSYAHINHDYGRQAGRGGVGTVMGVKKVKAIVLHGTQSVPVADLEAYRKAGMALYKACKDAEGLKEWTTYGTTIVTSWCDEVGALPTRNFSAGSFEDGKTLYGPVMRKEIVITDKGCFGCPCPCGKYSRMKRYNTNVEGPEYETIGLMGSNLGIGDIQDVAQANLLCDDLGIDTISAGNAIAWAMECYEKGILTKKDTGGLDLSFGNVEAAFKMIEMIARREGLGALLAEGVKKAAAKGRQGLRALRHPRQRHGAVRLRHPQRHRHAAGLHDLRCRRAPQPRLGHHLRPAGRARPGGPREGRPRHLAAELPPDVRRAGRLPPAVGGAGHRPRPVRPRPGSHHRHPPHLGRPGDGRRAHLEPDPHVLDRARSRALAATGIMPSPRFYEDPPKTGATAGQITKYEDVQKLLDMYYEQRGWDANGIPTPATLEKFGLTALVA